MKVTDDSYAIGKQSHGYGIFRHKSGYDDGHVLTPWGYVLVYAQGSATECHVTRLTFCHGGRAHSREFKGKRYSLRGMVTKAHKFAQEFATRPRPGEPPLAER